MTEMATKAAEKANGAARPDGDGEQYITMTIAEQLFGIPVLVVHDVLAPQSTTPIPLAPPQVAGALGWQPRVGIVEGVRTMLDNIDYWRDAPVWTPENIEAATRDWFTYLASD